MASSKKVHKKKKLGSYPSFLVMVSFTVSLFVIGLLGLFLLHANELSELIQENLEIQVFLDKELGEERIQQLKKQLSSSKFSKPNENGPNIVFISKEQAANQLIKETGEEFVAFLGDNPLRDVFILKIHPAYATKNLLKKIKEALEKQDGVFEVVYRESVIENIQENITKISFVLSGIGLALLIIAFLLINNTIKLALYSQRFLIRSMQLVGATGWFIQQPFLLRALGNGVMSGIVACLLLMGVLSYGYASVDGLSSLGNIEHIMFLFLGVICTGALVGLLSSYNAVRKYLYTSLDDLY